MFIVIVICSIEFELSFLPSVHRRIRLTDTTLSQNIILVVLLAEMRVNKERVTSMNTVLLTFTLQLRKSKAVYLRGSWDDYNGQLPLPEDPKLGCVGEGGHDIAGRSSGSVWLGVDQEGVRMG